MNIELQIGDAPRTPHLQAHNLGMRLKAQSSDKYNSFEVKQSEGIFLQKINSNGIVSPFRLILTSCLICICIMSILTHKSSHWNHTKNILFYFNYNVLGNDDLSIYDNGDNIDECALQIILFNQMEQHFNDLIEYGQIFNQDSFSDFRNHGSNKKHKIQVIIERYTINKTLQYTTMSLIQFKDMIQSIQLRDYLLETDIMRVKLGFGKNIKVQDLWVIYQYQMFSKMMLSLNLSIKYEVSTDNEQIRKMKLYRILEVVLAFVLFISYSFQARLIYYNQSLQTEFKKNSIYWCVSLLFLNFVVMTSQTFTPMCATLQLLPVFQTHDSSNKLTFNFNVNLRYALPMVFGVLLPVYIFMNGYIFYSMIVYPGDYFDDYSTSFFSYFYNMFQYGTYEIFTELQDKGNFSYILYVILYFYMVLVATNLLPALFCTLIYRRINQRQLVRYIESKVKLVICPKCRCNNFEQAKTNYSIQIKSPKSPYLKSGTKIFRKNSNSLTSSPTISPKTSPLTMKIEQKKLFIRQQHHSSIIVEQQMTKMYIQDKLNEPANQMVYVKNRTQKLKQKSRYLQILIKASLQELKKVDNMQSVQWVERKKRKIQQILQINKDIKNAK